MNCKFKSTSRNILILSLFVCAILCAPGYRDIAVNVSNTLNMPIVVVDAGHGGIDGGAESAEGISEKAINLSIAAILKKELEAENIKVIMTRDEDEGLYDKDQKGAIRSLKTQDMKERKRIIDEANADLTVSIHLNSFTQDTSVKGAQAFYPAGDNDAARRSEKAAKVVQINLNKSINSQKSRMELAKNDVYLFQNISCPIIIVECGFLSNDEDAKRLQCIPHQKKIVRALTKGVVEYLDVTV